MVSPFVDDAIGDRENLIGGQVIDRIIENFDGDRGMDLEFIHEQRHVADFFEHLVGDLEIGRTGLCTTEAEEAGFAHRTDTIEATTKAARWWNISVKSLRSWLFLM